MDYVVGSVAALITGNVTPNRPKLVRRALTPTKHQPSPNVTPKSELVEDRSIFLSPTLQKKKAIVKKSPKRIFQNPGLDSTENEETNSPKADKVKKHLKDDLESEEMGKNNNKSPNKKQMKNLDASSSLETSKLDNSLANTEGSPKKKKKRNSESIVSIESKVEVLNTTVNVSEEVQTPVKTPKKKKQKKSQTNNEGIEEINELSETVDSNTIQEQINTNNQNKKNNKKNKKQNQSYTNITDKENNSNTITSPQTNIKKKKKKNKNKNLDNQDKTESNIVETSSKSKKTNSIDKKSKTTEMEKDNDDNNSEDEQISSTANPNAITEQDSDSEHDSDDEMNSENEQNNKQLLETEQADESTDEEDSNIQENKEKKGQKDKKVKNIIDTKEKEVNLEEEIKRTIFVGNVPLSKKTRKEIKKIFRPYGEIETVRIRFVPVKDARVTPKMAVIKNELHPERSTVNVYVKFADPDSVEKALAENNTLLNGNHLRVTRSSSTGSEHDPQLAIFVGNLPFGIEDEQLRAQFDKCGEIDSVRIIRDKKTNAGKGFGYVNFTSKDGVELALNLSEEDLTIKNRILRVKRCTQTLGHLKRSGSRTGQMNSGGENRPGQMNRPGGMNRGGQNRPGQMNRGGQNRGGMSRGRGERPGGMNRGGYNGPGQMNRGGYNRPGQMNRGGQNRPGQMNRPEGMNRGEDNRPSEEGAHRRIMNKRKYQENNDGPPNKIQRNIIQPGKEKKHRKEFVGMTSEKKKKPKFNKGQKQKKALSEILTKKKS